MAKEGGFFSPNRKVTGKDKQVASSMSSGSYGGFVDAGERRGFVSPEQAESMLANPERFKMRPSETRYLRESMGLPRAQFFSPSGNEVGQIASATSDLSGLLASNSEDEKFKSYLDAVGIRYPKQLPDTMKRMLRQNMRDDEADGTFKDGQFVNQLPKNYGDQEQKVIQDNEFNKYLKDQFGTTDMNYGDKQYLRESFDEGNPYKRFNFDQSLKAPITDTKVAMLGNEDNLGGPAAFLGGVLTIGGMGINALKNLKENFAPKLKENLDKKLNPEENRASIGDKVSGFLNRMMGISPVAAGTLDANQVSQVSERPKLGYVNPDAKTMSLSQIGEAFKPKNIFGYQDKFGRYDDPGSPLDKQRQETMQRVFNRFTRPITPDARTIGQIRADQKAEMQEQARQRYQDFKDRRNLGPAANIQKTFGADDTYGTNVPSNPAMGFRDQMTAVDKARYDKAAKEATAGAQTDPSLGNVMTQTINRVAARFGLPQKSLETVDQRQLRKAQEAYNKPRYQQEAYARKMLGITNDMVKADQRQRMIANAKARNQAFQLQKAIKASERAAKRLGGNIGTGRDGNFGTGTEGKGLPSNPKGFSGYSRTKSKTTSTGTGTGTAPSKSRGGISKSQSRGQGPGGTKGRSKGGTSTGGSKAKSSQSRGQGGGPGSRSKGGSFGGKKSRGTNTSKSRRRCDIRSKIDITSLTNQNLMKDDLATVAYFVQELRGE